MRNITSITLLLCFALQLGACEYEPGLCENPIYEVSDKSRGNARDFEKEVRKGKLRNKVNSSLDALIRYGAYKLNQKGYLQGQYYAKVMLEEWEGKWNGYLVRIGENRDLGDHKPLSEWLAQKYMLMEFILGKDLCHKLRLDDINTINFAIPVVFACVDDVDVNEYLLHFRPLSGVVVYWGTFFACVGFSWGILSFFCGPLAMGSEMVTENWIAPPLSKFCHGIFCK